MYIGSFIYETVKTYMVSKIINMLQLYVTYRVATGYHICDICQK